MLYNVCITGFPSLNFLTFSFLTAISLLRQYLRFIFLATEVVTLKRNYLVTVLWAFVCSLLADSFTVTTPKRSHSDMFE